MAKKSKKRTLLSRVGLWATIWWGVSCAYVLLVFWQAKNLYIDYSYSWGKSLAEAFNVYPWLWLKLIFIVLVWLIIAKYWLKALKQSKISLKAGLKDLFLTIR